MAATLNHRRSPFRPDSRRGSVFILVVAMLAVLALLAITLGYSTRMELRAANNLEYMIAAKITTTTGVPYFGPGHDDFPVVGFKSGARTEVGIERVALRLVLLDEDEIRLERRVRQAEENPASAASGLSSGALRDLDERRRIIESDIERAAIDDDPALPDWFEELRRVDTPLAENILEDESARINVNAIAAAGRSASGGEASGAAAAGQGYLPGAGQAAPAATLTVEEAGAIFDMILREKNVADAGSGKTLAAAIADYRYGEDRRPGRAGSDDNGDSGSVSPLTDGLDNDQDLVIDNPEEETFGPATDGIDNDLDGEIDEADESSAPPRKGVVGAAPDVITVDEPAEFCPDPRRPARGDDRPYRNLMDLMAVPGMTREIFDALEPHLTVLSVSQPAWSLPVTAGGAAYSANSLGGLAAASALSPADQAVEPGSGVGFRQLDPNTASAREIFNVLRLRFPELPGAQLAQFTVNIIDRRDADRVPTEFEIEGESVTYHGFELAPVISEVFPYTGALNDDKADGDDGQFVEITNPYASPMDLTGWRLQAGGSTVWLSGSIPSEGFLVVTDDYNESQDPEPEDVPGQGSLYDIFGTVPVGSKQRIEVQSALSIPDQAGRVTLYNQEGVEVDAFDYTDGTLAGGMRHSFQRNSPLDRGRVFTANDARPATPLYASRDATEMSQAEREYLVTVERLHDSPFRSALEVLFVPVNFPDREDPLAAVSTTSSGTPGVRRGSVGGPGSGSAPGTGDSSQGLPSRTGTPGRAGAAPPRTGRTASSGTASASGGAEFNAEIGAQAAANPFLNGINTSASDDSSLDPTEEYEVQDGWLFQFPRLSISSTRLDCRVADLFCVGAPARRPTILYDARTDSRSVRTGADGTRVASETEARRRRLRDAPPALFGRININTAPPFMVAALPGLDSALAENLIRLRESRARAGAEADDARLRITASAEQGAERAERGNALWYRALPPTAPAAWESLSELLRDDEIWNDEVPLARRIEALWPVSNLITFDSLSWRVVTRNIPDPTDPADRLRRSTRMAAERIIAADRGQVEEYGFHFLSYRRGLAEDPLLKAGVPDEDLEISYTLANLEHEKRGNENPPRYDGPMPVAPRAPALSRPPLRTEDGLRSGPSVRVRDRYESSYPTNRSAVRSNRARN